MQTLESQTGNERLTALGTTTEKVWSSLVLIRPWSVDLRDLKRSGDTITQKYKVVQTCVL